ncbi:MAG TPA: protein phosphatase 2C domain-containing protein, partial [Kofleriaceae bacterium]|nr:protein phosphatase 2C domain-containing protein [Kofleriaceae bacterium]
MSRGAIVIEAAGSTDVGKVRAGNEDSLLVDLDLGLYGVFDGMGGAKAGEVASQTARDAVLAYVTANADQLPPMDLVENSLLHACAAVFDAARADRSLHGMGTTAVVCFVPEVHRPRSAVIAHVGDSRAYLWRQGRMSQLTRDHTIVAELVSRGMISVEDAENHPYKNVLSRNLGAKFEAAVDVVAIDLRAGDRLLLCSDGLFGFASNEGIQYLLGSGDAAADVARDLIELALRGGGGDNITTLVIEAGAAPASNTQVVRTTGAASWWQEQPRFVAAARAQGLGRSPLCRGLPPEEAIELVAGSFCEALFHDLEKSTGVNVWTFAQNLGAGWLDHGGDWSVLRAVLDTLHAAAVEVVDAIRVEERRLASLLDIAVARALIVAELAVGNLLADRLRGVERELVFLHAVAAAAEPHGESGRLPFSDDPTIPFLRSKRGVSTVGLDGGIDGGLDGEEGTTARAVREVLTIARAAVPSDALLVQRSIAALEAIAVHGEDPPAVIAEARELYGMRTLDDVGLQPLFEALERVRLLFTAAVHQTRHPEATKARALRLVSTCHQRLVATVTGLLLDAVAPATERLRDAQRTTAQLRAELERLERRRAELE